MIAMKVGVLAPYTSLKEIIESEAEQFEDLQLEVVVAEVLDAVEPAVQFEKQGFHVLISRGGTADTIRSYVSIPVVNIDVSGYDILRSLILVKDLSETTKLIGFPSICRGVLSVASFIDIEIPYTEVTTTEEIGAEVEKAYHEGISNILGDAVAMKYVGKYGLNGMMITSGRESVHQSLKRAKELAAAMLTTKQELKAYRNLLTHSAEASLIFTSQGNVQFYNQAFRSLFQINWPLHHVQELNSPLCELISTVVDRPFLCEQFNINGTEVIVEGDMVEDVGQGVRHLIRFNKKERYSLETDRFSVEPLTTFRTSFAQLSAPSPSMKKALQSCQHYAVKENSPLLILGNRGTGKKSMVSAMHYERHRHLRDQWTIQIKQPLVPEEILQLKEWLKTPSATFYLTGWEVLEQESLTELRKAASGTDALVVFGSEPTEHAPQVIERLPVIHLPTLEEQKAYLDQYVTKLISRSNAKYGKQVIGIEKPLLDEWKDEHWPNNLKDLQERIEKGVRQTPNEYVSEQDMDTLDIDGHYHIDLTNTLTKIEEDIIRKVMKEESFNQTKTAKRLGINRATLWRKLRNIEQF
ncbi:sigma-54-dependent Fis family transcriptional regulator [Salsuginibacillus kocurii]|uniref:sigma-54-dependent Fis family transcriptional regulator n=1 Tax=Salsuginibacillus kocurii TaxID=427078 RepID=UPI0003807DC2|nr:sigma-54-dependent Fis family transcriptional regulator [Salsuginibacillus kocurii]